MGNPPTPTYTGIDFNNSSGIMLSNTITGSNYGIYCESYSSPWSGAQGQKGANVITNNLRGVVAYNNSMPSLGYGYLNPKTGYVYEGTCNSIYNNTQYDVQSSSYSSVTAEYDWWGDEPLDNRVKECICTNIGLRSLTIVWNVCNFRQDGVRA